MSHLPASIGPETPGLGVYSSMSNDLIDEPFLIGAYSKVIECLCFLASEEVIIIGNVPSDEVGVEGCQYMMIFQIIQ
jgi:hypothetical protein